MRLRREEALTSHKICSHLASEDFKTCTTHEPFSDIITQQTPSSAVKWQWLQSQKWVALHHTGAYDNVRTRADHSHQAACLHGQLYPGALRLALMYQFCVDCPLHPFDDPRDPGSDSHR